MMLAEVTTLVIGPNGGVTTSTSAAAAAAATSDGGSSNNSSSKGNPTTIRLVGRSRAGDGTAFAIPEYKWWFDCGVPVQSWTPRIVFLTHTHSDHVHWLTRLPPDGSRPPTICLPEEAVPYVVAQLKAYRDMTDCLVDDGENHDEKNIMIGSSSRSGGRGSNRVDHVLRPTRAGEEIPISYGGNRFVVRTLQMHHRIPCLGYSIFQLQSHLRDEYVGLSGSEIGQLRRQGIDVTTTVEVPYLCFMGDTTAKVFEDYPDLLRQQSVIVVECTFIDTGSRERAETTMHTHWDDLQPYIASHPNTMFILIHFSLKYSTLRLRHFFRDQQRIYDNIHPMLVEGEVERQWNATGTEGDVPRCNCRICRVEPV